MKNQLTLIGALLLLGLFTQAQINYYFDNGDNYGDGTKNMIGQREYKWNTNNLTWDDIDSFNLQYNPENRLTLRNYFEYDTVGVDAWRNLQVTTMEYNGNGLLSVQVDTSSNPASGNRYEFTYSGTNREIQKLDKLWSQVNSTWGNYRRYSTTHTGFDSTNVYLTEGWNPGSSVWINGDRVIYTYNPQNRDSTRVYEEWNVALSLWAAINKNTYTYDAGGNLTLRLYQEYDAGFSVFKNIRKNEFTYNGSNQMISNTESAWNVNINIWQYAWKYTYTYNGQGMLETEQVEKWNTGTLQWDLWTLYTHTYDAGNKPLGFLYQNRVSNAWENGSRYTYSRDANGYRTRYVIEFWNTNTLAWRNFSAIDYWYSTKLVSGIKEELQDKLFVYPNPSNSPVLFVNAEKAQPYTIYDLGGRVIQQGNLQPGTSTIIFEAPQGMYLLNAGNTTMQIVKH